MQGVYSGYASAGLEVSTQTPHYQTNSADMTALFWEIVKVGSRLEVPHKFHEAALGCAAYYHSSTKADTLCVIVNEPDARKIEDIGKFRVIEIAFLAGILANQKEEQKKGHVEKRLNELYPPQWQIHPTEAKAQEALGRGVPYAIWATKDTYQSMKPQGPGKRYDEFCLVFPKNPLMELLETLTGIDRTRHLPGNCVSTPFLKYKRILLEERLALLNSFMNALNVQLYPSEGRAAAFIEEQMRLKKDLPERDRPFVLPLAFYSSDDALFIAYGAQHPQGTVCHFKIQPDHLEKMKKEQALLLVDVQRLDPYTFSQVNVRDLALFTCLADLPAARSIGQQVIARR